MESQEGATQEKEKKDGDCFELDEQGKTRHEIVLDRCDCLIRQYLSWKIENGKKSDRALGAALIATAVTPLILLIPIPAFADTWAKFVAAALTASAAIATGLLAIRGWRENYIRYGYIWHTLSAEKFLYLTGSGEYNKFTYKEDGDSCLPNEDATKAFAKRVENLVMADVTDWRAFMSQGPDQ